MRLCPWADVVYGCDGPWWKHRNGLPEFKGTKLCHDSLVCAHYSDIHKIEILTQDKILVDKPGVVGNGGNSGFHALNIAVQFGATRILLIGFDMHSGGGAHWYGRNGWKMANNPLDHNFMRWRDAFTKESGSLQKMGIEVVNASTDSALRCFKHKTIDDVLAAWST